MDNKEKNNDKRKTLLSLLLPILIGSVICNIVLLKNKSKLVTQQEKSLLFADSCLSVKLLTEKQLNEVQEQLNGSQLKTDELHTVVSKLNDELKARTKTIEHLSKENNGVASLKKQIKNYKSRTEDYEKQMNNLLQGNNDLENKLADLNKTLTVIKKDNEDLKRKLEWANELKGYEIQVMNFKVNKNKQRITVRAKKTNRISVSFTLAENQVAEPGNKNIYLIIYDPKKNILTTKQEKFLNKKTNSEQLYSFLKVIEFKNEEKKVTIDYDTESKLLKGKYVAEIYADGTFSGRKEFQLR